MKELQIIKNLYKDRNDSARLDDCFFFDGKYLVTTDSISDKTHFRHDWSSPEDIAYKLVEVNVSDIAASNGLPKFAFLNLGLSEISQNKIWLNPFLKQLKKSFKKYNVNLAGGDTYHSPNTNLTLTLIGETKKPIFRRTGKVDDLVYLTGSVGLSKLGYKILKDNMKLPQNLKKEALHKHLRPEARLELAKFIGSRYEISAMMDITDGLVQDCAKFALASNLKIQIEIEKIPRLVEFQKYIGVDGILCSGEELELLFLSKNVIKSTKNFPVTCIGEAAKGKPCVEFKLKGKKYKPTNEGFLHF